MPTIVFIHGLWLHATSWQPWRDCSPRPATTRSRRSWPGDAGHRRGRPGRTPSPSADHGIDEVTEHYIGIIEQPRRAADPHRPLVRRHDRREAARRWGTARPRSAIDAAQIKGVLPLPLSALHATLPVFKNPANIHRAVSLTAEQFRYGFGNAISAGGVRRAVRAVDDPGPGQAAVRGGGGELLAALAGRGEHRQRGARAAAAGRGRPATTPFPEVITKATAEAVPALRRGHRPRRVPRPRAFADRRQRLARGRRPASSTWLPKRGL